MNGFADIVREEYMAEDEILFADEEDDQLFADEDESTEQAAEYDASWKILIVDDEREIHSVTKMVLDNFEFEGKPLHFLSAFSGEEAKKIIAENPDIAVVLLDVVMEEENSGLEVTKCIREELKNHFVRIILRTGQPGQAPERQVISEYDINDYKEKAELTAQKLYTVMMSSLRSYRDLRIIERNRLGLEQIIKATSNLFEVQSLKNFASGILTQLTSLLRLDESSVYLNASGFTATHISKDYYIIAGTGAYSELIDQPMGKAVPADVYEMLEEAAREKKSLFFENAFVGYFQTGDKSENLVFLRRTKALTPLDKRLIQIFASNVAVAFDNIYLNQEIVNTQKEVIFTLGEVVDNRSKETANHVKRVAEFCGLLAYKLGYSEEECELIRLAAPMHDVGKIGIPDVILNKPGKYTSTEFKVMYTHTSIGYNILKGSKRKIMQDAAVIAFQHHEKWDGTGYPQGLKGEEIHPHARIVALADVFDALSHKRIYKDAWTDDQILALFEEERGKHFDPKIVDAFLNSFDEFKAIVKKYPDEA
ncbi:MAG: DUF3369 domain-containing protein [Spirochaetia bacterium]